MICANQLAQFFNDNEHENGVAATSSVVRQVSLPQLAQALGLGHVADSLHGRAVQQLAGGVGFLKGHAVLCGFKWHSDRLCGV